MRPTMHDAVLFRLLLQIIDIPAVLPLAHALVVVTPRVLATDPIGVADEHRFHFMFLTKIHDLTGAFMAQVAHPALIVQRQLCASSAQLPPAPGTLRTAGTLAGDFAKLLAVVALQGADAAPGNNQRIPIVGSHSGLMNLAQIHSGVLVGRF